MVENILAPRLSHSWLLSLAVQLGVGEAVNVTKNCVTIMSTSSVSRLVFVACRTNMRQFSVARGQTVRRSGNGSDWGNTYQHP